MQGKVIGDKLVRLMKREKVSRAELARRLQVTRANVSQMLNDPANNWKLASLNDWARALGYEVVDIRFRKLPKEDQTK